MEKPLVSFIIPYYNLPADMLTACLRSILSLSLSDAEREVVIIDDGSEVSPINGLMDYADHITYVRQRHQGLSEARNTGIRMARGEYLQFIDADDQLLQAPYEQCVDLVRYHRPDMVLFNMTGQAGGATTVQADDITSGTEYMRKNNIHGSACGYLFRSAILGELRFTPGISHEDEEFTPQLMLRAESVIPTDAKAYLYRRRSDSITHSSDIRNRLRRLNDSKQVICRLSELADRLPAADRMAIQRRTAQLTMDYLYNVILQTGSRHYLDRRIAELRRKGLFPLPDRDYTTKYKWFRRLSNSNTGLSILMKAIPILRK